MQAIWKYTLLGLERQKLLMPKGAEILTAQMQEKQLCMWAIVSPVKENEARYFEIFGTGIAMPDGERKFVATVQDSGFVWHIFERLK